MVPVGDLLLFGVAALVVMLTSGSNMIYLISRLICQGRRAGVISLLSAAGGWALIAKRPA